MAYQNTYGAVPKAAVPRTYEHGYPLPPLDDFAREVEDIDTTPAYPTTAGDHQKEHNGPIMLHEDIDTTPAYPTTVGDHQKEHHGVPGVLHRSGSSSPSSPEDDGDGGRRKKKSLKDKIKEKLPGNHSTEHAPANAASTTTPGSTATYGKKGVMDKIKEKLHRYH